MNYKQATLEGTSYQRCKSLRIENPHASLQQTPTAVFVEESVIQSGGQTFLLDGGVCRAEFSTTAAIELRDPQTGEKTGQTMTHAELYQALYSLYLQTAIERDGYAPGPQLFAT